MTEKMNAKKNLNEAKEESVSKNSEDTLDFMNPFLNLFSGMCTPSLSRNKETMSDDLKEEEKEYRLSVKVPGAEKKDFDVVLDDGFLNVSAHVDQTVTSGKGKNAVTKSYQQSYSRSYYVGDTLTKKDILAKYDKDTLLLVIPKIDPKTALAARQSKSNNAGLKKFCIR